MTNTPSSYRIVLIEDDEALTAMLAPSLRYAGMDVIVAADGPTGLQAVMTHLPDLILLDWMLPGMDGLELCRHIRQCTQAPIIMLTARDAITDRVTGLDAGVDDYLVKPFHLDELLARMRARLRGRTTPANVITFGDLTLDLDIREAQRGTRRISLTNTEFQVLCLFMRHPRQVLSKEVILEHVWGYDFDGNTNIVEQYVRALRHKLGDPQLIHTIRYAGYILREDA